MHAVRGLSVLLAQVNARLHVLAAVIVVALALYLDVATRDWLWLILAMGLVLAAEAFNTAIEGIVDAVSPEWNAWAKRVKDVSALAVLLLAVTAALIGALIFWPYVFSA